METKGWAFVSSSQSLDADCTKKSTTTWGDTAPFSQGQSLVELTVGHQPATYLTAGGMTRVVCPEQGDLGVASWQQPLELDPCLLMYTRTGAGLLTWIGE